MATTLRNDYILIGLTGGIGSGKSTVAGIFEASGIPVLRADDIAKELMIADPELIEKIKGVFGEQAYSGGELDRKFLAGEIFNNPEKLGKMNSIVHPRTIDEQGIRARKLVEEGHRAVACEAALIFESGGEGRFDYLVVVDAARDLRVERAAGRDNTTAEEILRRDAAQIPAEQKVARADFVIKNNGSLADLERNAKFVATLLKSLPPRDRIETEEEEGKFEG